MRIHWVTDGPFDDSGLADDNVVDDPASRRGPPKLPLRERRWNRRKLAQTGDLASLSLNGVEVFRCPLEPTNQRVFGLFHYPEKTEARVRNVTHRGDWPRTLPPIASQELARPDP